MRLRAIPLREAKRRSPPGLIVRGSYNALTDTITLTDAGSFWSRLGALFHELGHRRDRVWILLLYLPTLTAWAPPLLTVSMVAFWLSFTLCHALGWGALLVATHVFSAVATFVALLLVVAVLFREPIARTLERRANIYALERLHAVSEHPELLVRYVKLLAKASYGGDVA